MVQCSLNRAGLLTNRALQKSSDPERPYCAVAKYADSTFSGFTFQLCDTAATTVPIYYQAITTMTSSSSYYTLTSGTTTTTTPPPPPQNSSSTPVGAIVGGVVGGVGKQSRDNSPESIKQGPKNPICMQLTDG
jgi:hypothetical protein